MHIPLKTEVQITKSDFKIDYQSSLLFIGSCFSDNIGGLMTQNKMNVLSNPFGAQYNPMSIAINLRKSITNENVKTNELVFHNHRWHSYLLHGSFSNTEKQALCLNANNQYKLVKSKITNASHLFLTFGTAWIYEHNKTNQLVSNCHKIPAREFSRRKLTIEEIYNCWKNLFDLIFQTNPTIKLIFTISPVRHLKDGAHENQVSKSILLLAVNELIKHVGSTKAEYYPAYEIVMDELRDYRYYANDMTHISDLGVQLIFNKFKECYMSSNSNKLFNEIEKILKGKNHRIDGSGVSGLEEFANSMLHKITAIEREHNYINFQLEKDYFNNITKN